MMAILEIPLSPASQILSTTLNGVTYNLSVIWNVQASCWVLNIADTNQVPILSGIPLVTGANLLEQYAYMNFGGALYAITDSDLASPPTYSNLGITGHLIFVTP